MDKHYNVWVNMLKKQLLDIYAHFESNPNKRIDPVEWKAYQTLLSVTTVDEFHQWRRIVADYGLAFTDEINSERSDNVLGVLDDLAEGASDAVLKSFISWKKKFSPSNWKQVIKDNERFVGLIKKAVSRNYDVHIVVFKCGDRWAAIGNDADRIFEIFGWQTGAVSDGNNLISWMFISHYGLEVLKRSEYSVKVIDPAVGDVMSFSFLEDLTSGYQQLLDYARLFPEITKEANAVMAKSLDYVSYHNGYKELVKAKFSFDGDKLIATLSSGKKVVIADGNEWRLERIGFPLVNAAGAEIKYLDKQ